jgi:hypothetical protein
VKFHVPDWCDDCTTQDELKEFCRARGWISTRSAFSVISLATGANSARRSFDKRLSLFNQHPIFFRSAVQPHWPTALMTFPYGEVEHRRTELQMRTYRGRSLCEYLSMQVLDTNWFGHETVCLLFTPFVAAIARIDCSSYKSTRGYGC